MACFSEILERFNRKERNLLVRDILGKPGIHPKLDEFFLQRVRCALKVKVPDTAWWATDYHISWLAGALTVYTKGEPPCGPFYNPHVKSDHDSNDSAPGRQLVEGNQEDIDLVIATGQDVILIEAKAYGAFTKRQINSKLARLRLLYHFCKNLTFQGQLPIKFHLALQGPVDPKHLNIEWPAWLCSGGQVPWIELTLAAPETVLEVTRCDKNGKSSAQGDSWKVFQRHVSLAAR